MNHPFGCLYQALYQGVRLRMLETKARRPGSYYCASNKEYELRQEMALIVLVHGHSGASYNHVAHHFAVKKKRTSGPSLNYEYSLNTPIYFINLPRRIIKYTHTQIPFTLCVAVKLAP